LGLVAAVGADVLLGARLVGAGGASVLLGAGLGAAGGVDVLLGAGFVGACGVTACVVDGGVVAVDVGLTVCAAVGLLVGVAVADSLAVAGSVAVGLGVAVALGVLVGMAVAVAIAVAVAMGVAVAIAVAVANGMAALTMKVAVAEYGKMAVAEYGKMAVPKYGTYSDAVTVWIPAATAGTVNAQALKLPIALVAHCVETLVPAKVTVMMAFASKPLPFIATRLPTRPARGVRLMDRVTVKVALPAYVPYDAVTVWGPAGAAGTLNAQWLVAGRLPLASVVQRPVVLSTAPPKATVRVLLGV
jgi:hypothetical protein